jgi:glucosamine-phosphate N-acetyltransferase
MQLRDERKPKVKPKVKGTDSSRHTKTDPDGISRHNIRIVKMQIQHLDQGFLETLDNLIENTSELNKFKAQTIFQEINTNPLHQIYVALKEEEQDIVVGTITLLVEPKFIFKGHRVGHIEDVSVRKGYQKLGIGSMLVRHAIAIAEEMECAKIVLDCSDETMYFYEKMGFSYQDNCMKKTMVNHHDSDF